MRLFADRHGERRTAAAAEDVADDSGLSELTQLMSKARGIARA